MNPAVWHRDKTSGVLRDLHPTERESFKYMRAHLGECNTTDRRLREQLTTAMQRGVMYDPMKLFERLGASIPGFAQAASRVLAAVGRRHLVLKVRSMSSALDVSEVFMDFHWRETHTLALITDFALDADSQRELQPMTANLLSPSVC